jgi:hypothetical protein
MKMKMLSFAVLVAMCLALHGGDIEITSLASNGRLTWTNSFTNGLFTIEWTPALGTNWHDNWKWLKGFWVSARTNSVDVPMFYRVKCATNLFVNWPGAGGQFFMSVSNAIGNVWTQQFHTLGYVTPLAGAGKEYLLAEVINPGSMGLLLIRITDSAMYDLDVTTSTEYLAWTNAPVGTTWTNYNYHGQWNIQVSVDGIEDVTNGAVTFPSCLRFKKLLLNGTNPRNDYYEWVQPGFGSVKEVDYAVKASENPPIIYQLQSWTVSGQ